MPEETSRRISESLRKCASIFRTQGNNTSRRSCWRLRARVALTTKPLSFETLKAICIGWKGKLKKVIDGLPIGLLFLLNNNYFGHWDESIQQYLQKRKHYYASPIASIAINLILFDTNIFLFTYRDLPKCDWQVSDENEFFWDNLTCFFCHLCKFLHRLDFTSWIHVFGISDDIFLCFATEDRRVCVKFSAI